MNSLRSSVLIASLVAKTDRGRRAVVLLFAASLVPILAIASALAFDSAQDRQLDILVQRDITYNPQGETAAVHRYSYQHLGPLGSAGAITVTVLEGAEGVALGWPGMAVMPLDGQLLVSPALREVSNRDLLETISPVPVRNVSEMPEELLSSPDELAVIAVSTAGKPSQRSRPIEAGFDQPHVGSFTPPNGVLVPAVLSILLPALALANAASLYFVSLNSTALASARIFGVTPWSVRNVVVVLSALSALVASMLSLIFTYVLKFLTASLSLGSVSVFSRYFTIEPVESLLLVGSCVGVATLFSAIAVRGVVVEPLDLYKVRAKAPRSAGRLTLIGLVGLVAAAFYYQRLPESTPEALVLVILVAIVVCGAYMMARLSTLVSMLISRLVSTRLAAGVYSLGLTRRVTGQFRGLLAPIAWGSFVAVIVLATLATLGTASLGADLAIPLANGDPEVTNEQINSGLAIPGVETIVVVQTATLELADGERRTVTATDCEAIKPLFGVDVTDDQCSARSLLVPRGSEELASRPDAEIAGKADAGGWDVAYYEPAADSNLDLIAPNANLEDLSDMSAEAAVKFDWSQPAGDVEAALKEIFRAPIVQYPRQQSVDETVRIDWFRNVLLVGVSGAVVLTLVAFVLSSFALVERFASQLNLVRVFGLSRRQLVGLTFMSTAVPMAAAVLVPLVFGVVVGGFLRDPSFEGVPFALPPVVLLWGGCSIITVSLAILSIAPSRAVVGMPRYQD